MHLSLSPRRLACAAALAGAAALTPVTAVAATGSPAAPAAGATAEGATASHPQQHQIAETTLTDFKVVLTATRAGTGLQATVTAAGYQNSAAPGS